MYTRVVLSILVVISVVSDCRAADAYLIRFLANGRQLSECESVIWRDDALLFNAGTVPAEVRVLATSNDAPVLTMPDRFTVLPGTVTSLTDAVGDAWVPPGGGLFTMHLDVPPQIIISSHDVFAVWNSCITLPVFFTNGQGQSSLPIFRSLVPANTPQVHLGTDLGNRASRTNVVVYNAGSQTANATLVLRRTCDNSIVEQRVVSVPPNTTLQVGGLSTGPDTCDVPSDTPWRRYTVVTVDQPSLSYVSNLSETAPNRFSGLVPTVDLAIAHQTAF